MNFQSSHPLTLRLLSTTPSFKQSSELRNTAAEKIFDYRSSKLANETNNWSDQRYCANVKADFKVVHVKNLRTKISKLFVSSEIVVPVLGDAGISESSDYPVVLFDEKMVEGQQISFWTESNPLLHHSERGNPGAIDEVLYLLLDFSIACDYAMKIAVQHVFVVKCDVIFNFGSVEWKFCN